MNRIKNTVKGIVIRESLRGGNLPQELSSFVTSRYQHSLGGIQNVEILVLRVAEQTVPEVAALIAKSLVPKGFYAHFVQFFVCETLAPQGFLDYYVLPDRLWVIFPNSVVIAPHGDSEAFHRCRTLGIEFGIPQDQMRFEAMFEKDHPNAN